jgi:hypothetical protein
MANQTRRRKPGLRRGRSLVHALWFLGLAFSGCSSTGPKKSFNYLLEPEPVAASNTSFPQDRLDQSGANFRPGDLIIGVNHSQNNFLMILANAEFGLLGHVGIIDIENGKPVVYEVFGKFKLQNGATIMDNIKGQAQKISPEKFFMRYQDCAIVRGPNSKQNLAMADWARGSLQEGIEFDAHFDPKTKEPSCPDYAAMGMKKAGYPAPQTVKAMPNESLREFMAEMGITTDEFLNTAAFENVPGFELVSVISQSHSSMSRRALIESYRIAHEGFRANNMKLGDFFDYDEKQMIRYSERLGSYLTTCYLYVLKLESEGREPRTVKEIQSICAQFFKDHFHPDDLIKGEKNK